MQDRYVTVDVDVSRASEDGLSMRFKRTAERTSRVLTWVRYESESGLDGRWRLCPIGDDEAPREGPLTAYEVEDSSDGVVLLIVGGSRGVLLTHEETGVEERAPYLCLSLATETGTTP